MDASLPVSVASAPFPWLSLIVLLPAAAALLMPLLPGDGSDPRLPRAVAIGALGIDLALMLYVFSRRFDGTLSGLQLSERVPWVGALGLEWSVAADGLSAPLVVLSGLVTLLAVTASWNVALKTRLYFGLLLVQASAQSLVFLSQDFLLFFLAWELELVPVYLLIAIWGGPQRQYAATKFILYTATASLLILISGLALALSVESGFTLNLSELAAASATGSFGLLCYLGFLVGFGVKLPMFPLHTWLPDAHGEANAPVSMLLAGVLLKMGGYALLRFNVEMLPEAHLILAPALIVIGIVNIVYGALNAFAQDNVKRRIACSSVSHMGFVLLGIGATNSLGMSGAMLQMISHGLIAAAMFFITGVFYERTRTLSIPNMGGLAKVLPITFAFFLAASLASLALPGMSGFVSEITVFLGVTSYDGLTIAFRVITIVLAAIGLVLTPMYLLSMSRRVFFGPRIPALAVVGDMKPRELLIGMSLLVPTLVIGFWPRVAIDFYEASTNALASGLAGQAQVALARITALG
jgi:NAD(P)H-quinone oxidoreductase subunit 4